MAIGGLFGGLLGWLFVGAVVYAYLSYRDYSVTTTPNAAFSDPGVGAGPWAHPTSSQTPIPLVFGTLRSIMPIIHYRLEGDQYRDMWLVCAVGEDWNTLSEGKFRTNVGEVWLNDTPLSAYPEYTTDPELYDREHCWARFYENGRNVPIYWKSEGKHVFQREVPEGGSVETYALQCTHDAGTAPAKATIRMIHQFEPGGSTQTYRVVVFYQNEVSGNPEIEVFNGSVYKHATQRVEAGKSSTTVEVGGTAESEHTVDLPWRGTFKVIVYLNSSTNEGKLYLDSVDIVDDTLQSEIVSSYGTSLLLIRVSDRDGTLVKPNVTGMVTGGPSNPAEGLLWVVRNKEVSLGVEEDYIDEISFLEAQAKCDEYGYTFNRAYCALATFDVVLQDMCKSGRLLLGEYGGKLACMFDEEVPIPNVPEVDIETMVTGVDYGDTKLQNIPNRFLVKYVEAQVDYTLQDLVYEDVALQEKAGMVNERTIELYGVLSQAKAWELGWYHALWAQASKWIELDIMPVLWTLSPGSVIKTVSSHDAYLDGREWMLVAFNETEPGQYRASGIEYKREAYQPSAYTPDYPDVYIETILPGPGEFVPSEPAGMVTISVLSAEPTYQGPTKMSLQISGIPSNALSVKVYRSLNGKTFALLTEIPGSESPAYHVYNEVNTWGFVWLKATVRSSKGETALIGAPTLQVYVPGIEDDLPGFGRGPYGGQPYGY